MLRSALPPLVTAYAVFVSMVLLARRRPVERPRLGAPPRIRRPAAEALTTALGGYVALLVIVSVFHVWLAGEDDTFASAAGGGALLIGLALATATAGTVMARRRRRGRR